MPHTPRQNHPRPAGQETILSYLRQSIIEGPLRPGDQLPPQSRVVQQFAVSPLTVTRAFKRLQAEGFVRTVRRQGTFVTDRPPHLTRYALVLPDSPLPDYPLLWSRFFQALRLAVEQFNASGTRHVEIYYDCAGHADSEEFQRLLRDLSQRTLAGLIFAFRPYSLHGSALMENWDIPRVATGLANDPMPAVEYNTADFLDRAAAHLKALGRKRLAVITLPSIWHGFFRDLNATVRRHGLVTRPFWTQAVVANQPLWARHAVHAIFRSGDNLPPDALIVTDDHLVEPVADALAEFNIKVPQDVAVVGHWNFPLRYKRRVPIHLLGWDARERLDRWIAAIDKQRQGKRVPARAVLPLRHAHEVAPAPKNRSQRRTNTVRKVMNLTD